MAGFVKQTKMGAALTAAMYDCVAKGKNPGRVGHRILTNNAKVGLNGHNTMKNINKAETAVKKVA